MEKLTWEAFESMLEGVIAAGLERGNADQQLGMARAAFFELTGQPFAEETGFERRDQAFYEYFLVDYRASLNQLPQLEQIATGSDSISETARRFLQSDFIVGTVRPEGDSTLDVKSWLTKDIYKLEVPSAAGFSKNDAIIARFFEIDGLHFASPACEVVPAELAGELKRQLKWLASPETTSQDMWASALRFQLVASRYSAAKPKEIVDRWMSLEKNRGALNAGT